MHAVTLTRSINHLLSPSESVELFNMDQCSQLKVSEEEKGMEGIGKFLSFNCVINFYCRNFNEC